MRVCQFQLHRNSDWGDRRAGTRTKRQSGEVGETGDAGRNDGEPDVCMHRGNPEMSVKKTAKSKRDTEYAKAERAAEFLKKKTKIRPKIALVLGSGLGAFADEFRDAVRIPYSRIPHFPQSTAIGHAGQLVFGRVEGVPIVAMQGRVHLYEGYSAKEVAYPMRVFSQMGVKAAILTNAAGGIKKEFTQGRLVAISDHINLQGVNPLMGANEEKFGPRFPDMTTAYDKNFREL